MHLLLQPYDSRLVYDIITLLLARRYLIIENFIPPEEKNKIMNRLVFDPEEDQWKFQSLVPTERSASVFDVKE